MLERSKQMSPEQIAAVQELTAHLREFTATCERIQADFALLAELNPAVALIAASIVANAFQGAAK
jgi:hypothetical protein